MIKISQSLLDFINFLPLQGLSVRRSPLSNREAQVLYDLWTGDRDPSGKVIVPDHIDALQISALTTKGMVKNSPSTHALAAVSGHYVPNRTLEITSPGREVIRNIILTTEKSTFENEDKTLDYESVFRANTEDRHASSDEKIASKIANVQRNDNWLYRACR